MMDCLRGTPDAIDGDLSDWNLEAMSPAVLDTVEQLSSGQDIWTGPEDCSAEFYMLWDDVNIYMAVVVTDEKLFLLDEDYIGDGCESVEAESGRRLGSPTFRLVDGADLQQIAEVKAADADPNAITILIRPTTKLQRTHRWRLLCRDRTGAEKLVEDVRKAMSMAD